MIPYLIIVVGAIAGAIVNGLTGLLVGGSVTLFALLIVSGVMKRANKGILPKEVRDETATDFCHEFEDYVVAAYPGMTPYDRKEQVANLVEKMYENAVIKNPSIDLNNAGDSDVFFPAAMEIAQNMNTQELVNMATKLVDFIRGHRLWYSHV